MIIVIIAAAVMFSSGLFEQFEEAFDAMRYGDPGEVPPELAKVQFLALAAVVVRAGFHVGPSCRGS